MADFNPPSPPHDTTTPPSMADSISPPLQTEDANLEFYLRNPPLGFRFCPTEEELIQCFLQPKMNGRNPSPNVIPEIDICKFEPWEFPEKSLIKKHNTDWFFFTRWDRKYSSGGRSNRSTKSGYWKVTGNDRQIVSEGAVIGKKKTLVFHLGRAPKGKRTDWMIYEYRQTVDGEDREVGEQDGLVIWRLFNKHEEGNSTIDCDEQGEPLAPKTSPPQPNVDKNPESTAIFSKDTPFVEGNAFPYVGSPIPIADQLFFGLEPSAGRIDYRDHDDGGYLSAGGQVSLWDSLFGGVEATTSVSEIPLQDPHIDPNLGSSNVSVAMRSQSMTQGSSGAGFTNPIADINETTICIRSSSRPQQRLATSDCSKSCQGTAKRRSLLQMGIHLGPRLDTAEPNYIEEDHKINMISEIKEVRGSNVGQNQDLSDEMTELRIL